MIPLILSQSGTTTAQTLPVTQAGAVTGDGPTFDKMMLAAAQAGDDAQGDAGDGVLGAAVVVDPDLPADEATPAPALTKDGLHRAELPVSVPTSVPVKGAEANSDNAPALQVPMAGKPPVLLREGTTPPAAARAADAEKQPDQTTLAVRESKSKGASVAQSVVEGRLPLKGLSETPPLQQPQPSRAEAAKADAPPPATLLSARSKPGVETADQVKDPQKPQFQPVEEQSRHGREEATPRATPNTPAPVFAAQPPAVALAQAVTQAQREMTEKVLKPADVDSILSAMPAERHATATGTSAPVASTAAPETARQAAAQIAVAVTNSNGKTTEIALNPEELGRVKLSLTAGDGVITVNLLADRPETQDLLRRHIDALAQEFRQLGYTSISFSFGEQKGQAQPQSLPDGPSVEQEIQDTVPIPQATPATAAGGLDLRI
ncbi:hypothetical protein AN191_02745 [Loktanella sp. 5RATIMAR09]|uniref:flagellar hook-length control protein FliK n=1 Tax=Loktanella sp. 5RATIMAR09 TaxID=1225655 RepID=UPI000707E925|nr:flagellar hook-length control protein FliK [Loktanella sp. 5RATIMAR09]KQI73792.1 hypothetical protein AN191_02745 [Loktanella sp. 5RATIMAR09]